MNQGIFLHFRQIFVNGGPMRLELVAVAAAPVRGRIFKNCMRVTRHSEIAAVHKFNTVTVEEYQFGKSAQILPEQTLP